jgi:putative methanogenesis marker protein 3
MTMRVIVNGKEKKLKKGATLKDAVAGEFRDKDALISVHLSTEKLIHETNDFELVTPVGIMVLHLDDSDDARLWKSMIDNVEGSTSRWVTREIVAFGSFPTEIKVDRTEKKYKPYECFFALGGFDSHTTYMMIARKDHYRTYGAGTGRIGKITVGRHLLDIIKEGEEIVDIRPVMSETSTENVIVTKDLTYPLDENYRVETYANVVLNTHSPVSAEQVLIIGAKGYINVTESTGTFLGCRDDMDVTIPDEKHAIREKGCVTVRNDGVGEGHVMFYRETRQVSPAHNDAGRLDMGLALVSRANAGDKVSIRTEPARALSVGLTQAAGAEFLSGFKIKQKRTGDTSDDAIIVEQKPEMTMESLKEGEVETFGVPRSKVFRISIDEKDEVTSHYFRKVTGLSHKPVGMLKVQFAFPGMPMVTFYGDEVRGKNLYPQDPFKKCKKGDIGVTNQSRPHHGLMGIRLQDSKEYGPSGEEPYGTNIVGKFLDDISLVSDLEEEEVIYVTEEKL